ALSPAPPTPERYTLSLHDALPISCARPVRRVARRTAGRRAHDLAAQARRRPGVAVSAALHGDDGRAHLLRALAGRRALYPRRLRAHAPVHLGFGAAADGNLQRIPRAHRPYDSGTLWHERNRHADVQPL